MDIARNNLSKSDKPFMVNMIPDDMDPTRQRVGFRMSGAMWQPLQAAINAGIVRPLTEVILLRI